ncbi:MAG TPA: AAA family ATPase [Burkholderiales bacterium]|nr:AAA family ATPase [Burkholderiales bacterium]
MPNLVVIAGPNGAGKSTTAPVLLRDNFHVHDFINADTIASGLSAFAPERVAFPAGRIMIQRMHELARSRADFALESTLSNRFLAPWIRNLRTDGYIFHLVYLWLQNADLAVQRVAERVRRGGHDVPEATVRRRYSRSLSNFFNIYRPIADSWLMLDNSAADMPTLIAGRKVGDPILIVKGGPWDRLRRQYEKDIV